MELLAFGKTGWGDELFYATLMTLAVSITAMIIGFFFALIFTPLKLSKNKFLNLIGNFYTTVIRGVVLLSGAVSHAARAGWLEPKPVSYTHLTLPTILLV